MIFRNYVYDAERMYKAVKDLTDEKDIIHKYYKDLQDAKMNYERLDAEEMRAKRKFMLYTGDIGAWTEMDRAKRQKNSTEMDMWKAFRLIQDRSRKINIKTKK